MITYWNIFLQIFFRIKKQQLHFFFLNSYHFFVFFPIFWEKKITKILKRLHKNFDASTANFFFFWTRDWILTVFFGRIQPQATFIPTICSVLTYKKSQSVFSLWDNLESPFLEDFFQPVAAFFSSLVAILQEWARTSSFLCLWSHPS